MVNKDEYIKRVPQCYKSNDSFDKVECYWCGRGFRLSAYLPYDSTAAGVWHRVSCDTSSRCWLSRGRSRPYGCCWPCC